MPKKQETPDHYLHRRCQYCNKRFNLARPRGATSLNDHVRKCRAKSEAQAESLDAARDRAEFMLKVQAASRRRP